MLRFIWHFFFFFFSSRRRHTRLQGDWSSDVCSSDLYLEVPFDLSGVMFIATANSTVPIPDPLLDRMEQLTLVGYTPSEKLQIAKRYLMPRQMKETGLGKGKVAERAHIADGALERLIAEYTREAGVRQLEREIQGVLRKAALEVVEGKSTMVKVLSKI